MKVERGGDRFGRDQRRRAGSSKRDALHRHGGFAFTVPEGVYVFTPKAGVYKIDIIPYEVKSNPYAECGYWYYERTYWAHRSIGVNGESVVCMAKTFGEPCAVCDLRAKLARNPEIEESILTALKPKERQLWLVFDHGEPRKGVQLWETSYHTFGLLLERRRQTADEDDTHIRDFDDWNAGSTLRVVFTEEQAGNYSFLNATSIDFKPRSEGLDLSLLDHDICLDDLIQRVSYDEAKALLLPFEQYDEDSEGMISLKGRLGPSKKSPVAKPVKDSAKPKKYGGIVSEEEQGDQEEVAMVPKKVVKKKSDEYEDENEDSEEHRGSAVDEVSWKMEEEEEEEEDDGVRIKAPPSGGKNYVYKHDAFGDSDEDDGVDGFVKEEEEEEEEEKEKEGSEGTGEDEADEWTVVKGKKGVEKKNVDREDVEEEEEEDDSIPFDVDKIRKKIEKFKSGRKFSVPDDE